MAIFHGKIILLFNWSFLLKDCLQKWMKIQIWIKLKYLWIKLNRMMTVK